jgi:hypothetical protein
MVMNSVFKLETALPQVELRQRHAILGQLVATQLFSPLHIIALQLHCFSWGGLRVNSLGQNVVLAMSFLRPSNCIHVAPSQLSLSSALGRLVSGFSGRR